MTVAAAVNASFGATLSYGVTVSGTTTYHPIAQITDLDGPTREILTRDTTNLNSTVTTLDVAIPTGGAVSGTLQWDPKSDSHAALEAITTLCQWQMAFGDVKNGPTTATFAGVLSKPPQPTGLKRQENLLAAFEIKVSGAITIA